MSSLKEMEKEIIVKPSFNISSSMKATYYILWKPWYFIFFFFLLFAAIFGLADYFFNIVDQSNKDFPTFGVVIIILPLFIYFSIRKKLKKQITENPRIKEDISYIFNNEYLQEKGDTFEVKHFWKNLIKIVEKKDMFLFYTTKNTGILLQRLDLNDNQYNELKQLFNSLDIKKSLKS